MNLPARILVAVDFSTGSHAALQHAARAAVSRKAALHVLHVVDAAAVAALAGLRGEGYESHAASAARGAQAALKRWIAECALEAPSEEIVVVGQPLHEILAHAAKLGVGLLVAGLQGAGQSKEGAGSVAAKLARKSPVSVLLVRPGHKLAFQKIVACVDFSSASALVMAEARQRAWENYTGLECLHVWKEPWVVDFDPDATGASAYPVIIFTKEERRAHQQQLREELHQHVGSMPPDVPCKEVLREAMNHGSGIIAHANESRADLIVIGSTGRGTLRHVLLGSTAERLLHHAPCSVLVVRIPAP